MSLFTLNSFILLLVRNWGFCTAGATKEKNDTKQKEYQNIYRCETVFQFIYGRID